AGHRAPRGPALVLELRGGSPRCGDKSAARRRVAAGARAGPSSGRRNAGRYGCRGTDLDEDLSVLEAQRAGERVDLPESRRRKHLLQAARSDRGGGGDRPHPGRHGAAGARSGAGVGGERHREHGRHRRRGRPGARPPPQAPRMTAHATRPAEGKRYPALEALGLTPQCAVHWNLGPPQLYEHAVRRAEGIIAEGGAFAAVTTPHTGRSPNDKFIVHEPTSAGDIRWGKVTQPLDPEPYQRLKASVLAHLAGQELFVRDLFAGADPNHRFGIRFITPNAWQALFVYNMFLRPTASDLATFSPAWTVLHAPELHADPAVHSTKSGTFVVINFGQRTALIGGTRYAGEMKKAVFTILNYLLPNRGILSMH